MPNIYKFIFIAAGCYQLVYGFWLMMFPDSLFQLIGYNSPSPRQVDLFHGLTIMLLSSLYYISVVREDWARNLIKAALVTKIIPTPTLVILHFCCHWPMEIFKMNLFNDYIWMVPIVLFLRKE